MNWSQSRVLVVGRGDSPSADSAHCFLSAQGAQLDRVEDLAEALLLLKATPGGYAAVLVCLADFGGEELGPLRAIRRLYPGAAVVALVDAASRGRAALALQLGADALLPEPFYRAELVALIERTAERIAGAAPALAETIDVAESAGTDAFETVAAVETGAQAAEVLETGPPAPAEQVPQPEPADGKKGSGTLPSRSPTPFSLGEETQVEMGTGTISEKAPEMEPVSISGGTPADGGRREEAKASVPAPATAPPAEPPPSPALPPHAGRAAARVLLVDRERLFRELLADVLRQHGYYVADAADEKQALWCLADEDYDAIVVDVGANGAGRGLEAYRQAVPETPIVAVTSLASPKEQEALRAAGAAACIGKPFDLPQLVEVLSSVLPGRAAGGHPLLTQAELDALLAPDER